MAHSPVQSQAYETTRNIFVVEDHEWARNALAGMLALQPGLTVSGTAANGEQALERLTDDIDLLLTDFALGGMSGIELIREARNRFPNLRCLVLSNHPANAYAAAASEAGSLGYVEKGNAPALLAAIEGAFNAPPGEAA